MLPDPQQVLDASGEYIVRGEIMPDSPLFLGDGQRLTGGDPFARLNAYNAGHAALVGWRRGLVDDSHFPGTGYRTGTDTHLFARGTEWDSGPKAGGWATVTRFKVVCSVTRNFAGAWDSVGYVSLAGMNNPQGGFARRPAPWNLIVQGGNASLSITTDDGVIRESTVAITPTDTTLTFTFDLDLEALYGTGRRLAVNSRWPFGLGRFPPYCNDSGYYGAEGAQLDLTFNQFEVWANGAMLCQLGSTRAGSYAGAPSLPLVVGWTASGGRWLTAVHSSQGANDSAGTVKIAGLELYGRDANPILATGTLLGSGGLNCRDVKFTGGSRGIQTSGLFVNYPLTAEDCRFTNQGDAAVWLLRAAAVTIDRVRMDYPLRTCGEFLGSRVWIKGESMLAPPGPPAQEAVFIQRGGDCRYDRIASDYEYSPGPEAFLKLFPDSYDNPADPTNARLAGCMLPGSDMVSEQPAAPGYTGVMTVTTDG